MTQPLIEFMYEALNSEFGIIVDSESPEVLRAKFYELRRKYPEFECLSMTLSRTNPERELWVVRKPEEPDAES